MKFLKFIRHILFFILTFLLGVQTIYAKTELDLPQNNVSFSIEKTQVFTSLEKELQPNIGFLKEKSRFVISESVYAQNQYKFSEYFVGNLANTVGKHPNWVEISNITNKIEGLTPHVLKVETKVDGSFFPKTKNIDGQSFQMEGFKGCHSENALKEYVQANGGTYTIKNKSLGQGGVYEGQPVINLNNKEYVKINGRFVEYESGKLGGTSSFFPENWSNAKIKQEVEFALTNNHGKVDPDDIIDNLHYGFSSDGTVEIHFYLNPDGSIGSYFPKKR